MILVPHRALANLSVDRKIARGAEEILPPIQDGKSMGEAWRKGYPCKDHCVFT